MATRTSSGGRPPSRDSTELSVVPALSDPASAPATSDEPVDDEHWANEPASSDVSLIDAVEDGSLGSRELDGAGEHVGGPDRAPTEVMRLAFSGMGPPDLEDGARSLEVRSWHAGAPSPASAQGSQVGSSVFAVSDTHQMNRPPTRVDTELDPVAPPRVDLAALRDDLDELERLVRASKAAAAGLPFETARGLNAQLASALHRIGEARSRLR